ncbi:hypothetical protein EDD15DRAFT_2372091 [Pisolithus albus]|nr:hypothetical protein EDD15DRAFT_2372091 [Pisolithus albus]
MAVRGLCESFQMPFSTASSQDEMPADVHRFSQLRSHCLEFVHNRDCRRTLSWQSRRAKRTTGTEPAFGPRGVVMLPDGTSSGLPHRISRIKHLMPQSSRRPTGTPYEPFHPYKKVAEDALSRGIVNIDTIHTSGTGTDSRLAAIVRKQAARFARHRRDRKQASRPRPPGCGEPEVGNDVPAGVEDSTRIQQSTHDEMLVSTVVPEGVPSSDAMPERTSATREVLPRPVGFFGGMWRKLIGDAPVPGVHIPTNSAVARAEQCGQRDEEVRKKLYLSNGLTVSFQVLARKRRREDEDDEGNTTVAVGNSNQEQRDNPRAQPEKPRERKRRRDTEPEKSTRTDEANFIDDLQQDGYVDEESGQTGGTRQAKTVTSDSGDKSTCDNTDTKQGGRGEEAAYPEDGYSSSTDESAGNSRDPEQGGDGEEAVGQEVGYITSTDESMSDVEHAEEDADWEDTEWDDSDWEEESRNEFEDCSGEREPDGEESDYSSISPFFPQSNLEDCQVGEASVAEGKGESERAQVADIQEKNKATDVDSLAFPRPLDMSVFSPVPSNPQSSQKRADLPDRDSAGRSCMYPAKSVDPTALQELQVTLENKIRQNMREELGQIVESAVTDAIAKAFSNGMVRSSAPDSTAVSENSLPLAGRRLKKVKQLPRPRPSDHNAFKKSVRELGQKLLGLEGSKELPQPIGEKEIAAWDPGSGPCCTVDNFSVDLLGYARSEWNRSAAQVFAMEYVKHYKGENRTLEFVAEAWLTRVAGMHQSL